MSARENESQDVRSSVAKIRAAQHCTRVFVISITGSSARLIRRDQRGALISEACDLAKDSGKLSGSFTHYEHGSLLPRGFDDSVSEAAAGEISRFEKGVKDIIAKAHPGLVPDFQRTLDPDVRTYKVLVPVTDRRNAQKRGYIIHRPSFENSQTGVCTLGYLAWGCTENKVLFLKDTWRECVDGQLSEARQLERLNELNVPRLPIVHSGGDIFDSQGTFLHCTFTQIGVEYRGFPELIHHRIVQDLAMPLAMVQNSSS